MPKSILTGLFAGLLISTAAHAASVSSTFTTGSEGWQVGDINNLGQGFENATWHSSGGHPGGYVSATDDFNLNGFFAPSTFTGNKSAFYGGTFSFDTSDSEINAGLAPALFLFGNGQVISIGANPPATGFTHYSFTLTEAGFDYYSGDYLQGTTPVSEAAFKAVLGNLTNVAIEADWHSGADLVALDNVVLATGSVSMVPLPSSAPMLGGALLALGAAGFGMRHRRGPASA
jgi:hypothetical protein